jgi:uncharacterized protein (UPF0147 family)
MEVDKDLDKIAEYLSVCLCRDEKAKKELVFFGVKPADISEALKKDVQKAIDTLRNTRKDPINRIDTALEIVKDVNEKAPSAVGKYILRSARNRLNEALMDYNFEGGRPSALLGTKDWSRGLLSHLNTSYSLDLFISKDRKTIIDLKKLGVSEVPSTIREAAKRAKDVMGNEKLEPKERAVKAVDILMEPLLPTYSGDRSRKNIQELTPEVKGVIWHIADELATGAY